MDICAADHMLPMNNEWPVLCAPKDFSHELLNNNTPFKAQVTSLDPVAKIKLAKTANL